MFGALDDAQRETLYELLHQATSGHMSCTEQDAAVDDC